jgi:hydroxyacylglutathione hydrolase
VICRPILHSQMGCASYIFGCTGKRSLAVVDPHIEHVEDYLAIAAAVEVPVTAIVETHVQADHLSGAADLADRTAATLYLHEEADVTFPHRRLRDGDEIVLGNDYIRVLHTPGHSPDSITLLVRDRVRSDDPWFALTGDTLFVGDAGRPDLGALEGTGDAATAASTLYASLRKLLALPDDLEVYPGHFAGSTCGRSMSGKPSSTIGFERRFNLALRVRSREEFVTFMLRDLPPAPSDHARIRQVNWAGLASQAMAKRS